MHMLRFCHFTVCTSAAFGLHSPVLTHLSGHYRLKASETLLNSAGIPHASALSPGPLLRMFRVTDSGSMNA